MRREALYRHKAGGHVPGYIPRALLLTEPACLKASGMPLALSVHLPSTP
jgi:hypothetical protein